jgi:predicted HD phosphohydrolase
MNIFMRRPLEQFDFVSRVKKHGRPLTIRAVVGATRFLNRHRIYSYYYSTSSASMKHIHDVQLDPCSSLFFIEASMKKNSVALKSRPFVENLSRLNLRIHDPRGSSDLTILERCVVALVGLIVRRRI